jgi:hypothetical protein
LSSLTTIDDQRFSRYRRHQRGSNTVYSLPGRAGLILSLAIYVYEDGRLRQRIDPLYGEITFTYEGDKLMSAVSIDSFSELANTTEFSWTDEADSCAFQRAWYLLFLTDTFGVTTQELLTHIYGRAGPTEAFL